MVVFENSLTWNLDLGACLYSVKYQDCWHPEVTSQEEFKLPTLPCPTVPLVLSNPKLLCSRKLRLCVLLLRLMPAKNNHCWLLAESLKWCPAYHEVTGMKLHCNANGTKTCSDSLRKSSDISGTKHLSQTSLSLNVSLIPIQTVTCKLSVHRKGWSLHKYSYHFSIL